MPTHPYQYCFPRSSHWRLYGCWCWVFSLCLGLARGFSKETPCLTTIYSGRTDQAEGTFCTVVLGWYPCSKHWGFNTNNKIAVSYYRHKGCESGSVFILHNKHFSIIIVKQQVSVPQRSYGGSKAHRWSCKYSNLKKSWSLLTFSNRWSPLDSAQGEVWCWGSLGLLGAIRSFSNSFWHCWLHSTCSGWHLIHHPQFPGGRITEHFRIDRTAPCPASPPTYLSPSLAGHLSNRKG